MTWIALVQNCPFKSPIVSLCQLIMLKSDKLQNAEACLRFLASKCQLTEDGLHYKSNQAACIIRMTTALLWPAWWDIQISLVCSWAAQVNSCRPVGSGWGSCVVLTAAPTSYVLRQRYSGHNYAAILLNYVKCC